MENSNLTLVSLLEPNIVANTLITRIDNGSFDAKEEEDFFKYEQGEGFKKLDLIVSVAHARPAFAAICQKKEYDEYWSKMVLPLKSALIEWDDEKICVVLSSGINKAISSFDFVRGLYFFQKSREVHKALNMPADKPSYSEIEFLKKAMEYHSIHAMQQYHKYRYQSISDSEDGKKALIDIISDCKNMLDLYGSYAYMMLAEAYVHYAMAKEKASKEAEKVYAAALAACDEAENHLISSQDAINDASLGAGLGYSNSYGISNPKEAKEVITQIIAGSMQIKQDSEKRNFCVRF